MTGSHGRVLAANPGCEGDEHHEGRACEPVT